MAQFFNAYQRSHLADIRSAEDIFENALQAVGWVSGNLQLAAFSYQPSGEPRLPSPRSTFLQPSV
ncbi:MAG: hypothetical protein HOB60_03370 [Methylococcales bacterium]|nr:hypothetical protein [Methylococcales bacterium]